MRSSSRLFSRLIGPVRHLRFKDSSRYWEKRYNGGGTSGSGSYGRIAEFKAGVLNAFVKENSVETVLEFGCGDGNQLTLAAYPRYLGLDVSSTAIQMCAAHFAGDFTKSFVVYRPDAFVNNGALTADLVLSLDVIYHLVEDEAFEAYMCELFRAASQFVCVFSTNQDRRQSTAHVRHRRFTVWVDEHAHGWELLREIPNPHIGRDSEASFHFYQRVCG